MFSFSSLITSLGLKIIHFKSAWSAEERSSLLMNHILTQNIKSYKRMLQNGIRHNMHEALDYI